MSTEKAGAATGARPAIIQLAIKDKAELFATYVPGFTEGGVFVPSKREHRLGDEIYVLLSLPEDLQRYPIAGKVAWITPAKASGNRVQGVGVRFPKDEKSAQLKVKIEQMLGSALGSERPTLTF